MKAKYHGLFSIVIILSSIGLTLFYYATDSWKSIESPSGNPDFKPLPLYPEPSPLEMSPIDQLSSRMDVLRTPLITQQIPSDLRLLGYMNPNSTNLSQKRNNLISQHEKMDYLLSFTFSSGSKQFCILNNTFYQEGALLPDGSKILMIQTRQVLLDKDGIQNWIQIDTQTTSQKEKQQHNLSPGRTQNKEKK